MDPYYLHFHSPFVEECRNGQIVETINSSATGAHRRLSKYETMRDTGVKGRVGAEVVAEAQYRHWPRSQGGDVQCALGKHRQRVTHRTRRVCPLVALTLRRVHNVYISISFSLSIAPLIFTLHAVAQSILLDSLFENKKEQRN